MSIHLISYKVKALAVRGWRTKSLIVQVDSGEGPKSCVSKIIDLPSHREKHHNNLLQKDTCTKPRHVQGGNGFLTL